MISSRALRLAVLAHDKGNKMILIAIILNVLIEEQSKQGGKEPQKGQ